MPSVVSAPLAHVAALLRCPVCCRALSAAGRTLRCDRSHSFDVARHGYVTLMPPRRRPATGDDAAMVAARVAILDGKHFAPLTAALARAASDIAATDAPVVLDVGAGTGHHLAAVLDGLPDARGVAFDASRPALRHAARAHPRIAAVAGDVWHHVAVRDATVDLAGVQHVGWELRLSRLEAEALVRMGPAARHLTPAVERRLRALPETVAVSAAVDLHIFRRHPVARPSRSASSTIRPSGPRT